jgi:hypothetical protein
MERSLFLDDPARTLWSTRLEVTFYHVEPFDDRTVFFW